MNRPDPWPAAGALRQPERRLLLACLRRRRPEDLQALAGPELDWERLLGAAALHSITPLVYAAFKQGIGGAAVPPAVMDRLAHEYYQQAASNGHLFAELRKIVGACGRAGIPVLVLKGTAIAERVYGNIALCPMRDLDFLVRRTDLDAADGVLHELGYTHDESYRWAAWYRDHHHHLPPYVRADGRGIVELHHHLVPPPVSAGIPIEDLWRRARPAGDGALVLCPEDLLLHLCLHASLGHQFNLGLRPMCDISETIRYYGDDIDWTQMSLRAREWGIGKYVYLALRLSKDLLGAAVPDDLVDPLRPKGFDPRIIAWAAEQVFADRGWTPSSPLAQLYGPMRLRERVALLLQSACPPPKAMARLYPAPHDSKRIYLYYPVRWWDLMRKYGRPARHLLRRGDAMTVLAEREDQKSALRKWLTPDPLPERSPGA
ncbi:MAG TPA: nucleotidyltransferase family protein [bacterium]